MLLMRFTRGKLSASLEETSHFQCLQRQIFGHHKHNKPKLLAYYYREVDIELSVVLSMRSEIANMD